jgi:RHS repeat-associated protein
MAWTTSYYHHDAQGSTRLLTDSNQQVTDRYEYDAFGNQRSVTGTTVNPFRFIGQLGYYYDSDSDNYYVRQREYRPAIIVWLSADPLGFDAGDANWYRYALNQPITAVDPNGDIVPACSLPCPRASQRTPAACCAAAVAAGLAGKDAGGVVCCDGRTVPCVFVSGGGLGTTNAAATAIIDACITAHENQHIKQGDQAGWCPRNCGALTRPPFPLLTQLFGNIPTQECTAYRVELDCLSQSILTCGGVPACVTAVSARMSFVATQIVLNCR